MLDLVFLALMLTVLIFAFRGEFKETLCTVATVVGIVAAIVGLVSGFLKKGAGAAPLLNIAVLIIAALLRMAALQFVKLHEDKEREEREKLEAAVSRYSRDTDKKLDPVYTEENFDDPELRFGKGGYTDKWD
ncbi:MAG: hypothetical protein NC299_06435 [Lachnospiraceae bacterium]|nr:hypothetical protein [Ruminococcus sp.]MCM1274992.1 hypothetical protein [Lachnospiraceae bacterium]